ncbi:inositol monophosphatase family protein [Arhodomonas sp. AD133]|uniref:inositol monophosphatase family protein n=1 Tax=Arhodomonas sp. AD133 TaxID=3415009 RepID=UPI003EBCEB40
MHPMVNIAVRAARSAGNVIVRNMDRLDRLHVEAKGNNDFVSDVDRMAEREIVQTLKRAYPDHGILGEEYGGKANGDYLWVIDPLDGTTNYLHGFPHFAVSIALLHRGAPEVAVIYDPVRQELFTATRGGGATIEGRRIRMRPRRSIEGALLGTGFPFRYPEHQGSYLGMFQSIMGSTGDIRRAGSAALDLAYVACGRLDGFWELGLSPWDIAAGVLLIQEAGGIVSDFAGDNGYLKSGNVVAGSLKLHADLLRHITPHLTDDLRC